MITLENLEFFGFEYQKIGRYLAINIMVDPQEFPLKTYKPQPFCSLMIKKEGWKETFDRNDLIRIIKENFSNDQFYELNLYKDDLYDEFVNAFPNWHFHTMIYYKNLVDPELMSDLPSMNLLVAAIPVKGIVQPILRSPYYKLYNGCLISCNSFNFEHDWYSRIIYVLVNIKTDFDFREFIATEDLYLGSNGYLNYHHWIANDTSDSVTTLKNASSMNKIPVNGDTYDLFSIPGNMKSIFCLSDVPKDIMTKSNTLSVKI